MKEPKLIMYAETVLQLLSEEEIKNIPEKAKLSEEQVIDIMNYLQDSGYIKYVKGLGGGFASIINIKITAKGAEVALGKRELIDTQKSNIQQIHIHAPVQNISQIQGNNNTITQIVDNSRQTILRRLIENDDELKPEEKKSLFGILEKFNTLKESGENAYDLISKVVGIAAKYGPLFFALLN
jgi:hypothetical protein